MRDIYVDANGLRHHLTARGNPGSPIVMMVHGLTQQAHVFDGVAALLGRTPDDRYDRRARRQPCTEPLRTITL